MAAALSYGLEMGKRPPKRVLPTDLRQILGANVTRMMEATDSLKTQMQLKAKAGIGQRTVGRIKKGLNPTNVDTIQALAEAFGVAPWEMLFEKKVTALKVSKIDDDLKAVSDSWQHLTADDREEIRETASQ